jgi:ferric-dicitrate binding protein FerR (iron transport regulator)
MNPQSDIVESLIRGAGRRIEPPEDACRQVFAAAQAAFRAKAAERRDRRRMLWAGAAAAAALVVAVSLRWELPIAASGELARVARVTGQVEVANGSDWRPVEGTGLPLLAGARIRTLTGGLAAIELEGGSSLRIAPETAVMLDAPGRLYLESGTVYVDSGARPSKSGIEIVTAMGTARDVGTQFELRFARSALRLRVREGAVTIDHGGRSLTGEAGEEVAIDGLGGVQRTAVPPTDPAWQWAESVAPMPDMDGQPASALIAWVARETGRSLRYASPLVEQQAASVILHGEIRHLAPMQALEAMLATTDLRVELDGDTMEVRSRSH